MNIGIVFTGISDSSGRDFSHCFSNIERQLINPFKANNSVNIYLTTYVSNRNQEILNLYKPLKYQFLNPIDSHQVITYKKSMELLKNEQLDFIISTRFDIHFHKDFSKINLDFNKFNSLFKEKGWWNNMNFTTDNFFAFKYSMLNDFICVLDNLYINPSRPGQTDLHQVFYRMQNKIGQNNTNIVSSIDELSNYNSFYSLCNMKWGKCNV